MKNLFISTLLITFLLTGCQTYQSQTRTSYARQTEDQLMAQEARRRMTGRIETLEMEISRIDQEIDTLNRTLEARCAGLERKTEEDKRELIDRLTKQLERLIAQSTPPPQQATPAADDESAYGYEHEVRPGETLSTIAKAYNVTTQAIIKANKIKDPDKLSVGQKLFIPE